MRVNTILAAAALLSISMPAVAAPESPAGDAAAVRQVLGDYIAAVEKLDATGTDQLFSKDSAIFETGGFEGTYTNYLEHHLAPELRQFKSFDFSKYEVNVRFEGPLALATETYNYRIETKDGKIVDRVGVATIVLRKENGRWKIVRMHSSARKPSAS